jgi:hypothetical protein
MVDGLKKVRYNVWSMKGEMKVRAKRLCDVFERWRDEEEEMGRLGLMKLVSIDMKSASDMFRGEWVDWFLECVCENVDDEYERYWLRRMKKRYSVWGSDVEGWNVYEEKVGWSMGVNLSFVCLSVMNYVAADGGKSVSSGVLVGGKSVRMGDDCLGYWSADEYWSYRKRCGEFGLVINEGKTWISEKRGLFCEEIFEWRGKRMKWLRRVRVGCWWEEKV